MDDPTSLGKLNLLPKLDPVARTLSHVKAQRAYITFYASEGRTYMSSWGDESASNITKNTDKNVTKETAMIDISTPVLKPRVKQASKSSEEKNTTIVPLATTNTTKRRYDEQGNGEKRELKGDKSRKIRKKMQTKKRRKSSPCNTSSTAERLRKRRERKRTKRAIVSPFSSLDKENVEEKCSARKIPVGFALMHGFTATNVGKNRLTVKPSVSIGVFNKGKASVKTKATKAKISGTKGHAAGYFSESVFLNKTRAVLEKDETSCISIHTSSSSVAKQKSSKKISKRKFDGASSDVSAEVSDIKATLVPNSSSKKSNATSIVWDIELDKSLCSIDPPISTAPAEIVGSVVLDVTHHNWAKLLDRCSPNQNKTPIGESEALASIGPSQSASQIITKITSPVKRRLQETQSSKYFTAELTKSQSGICAEFTFPVLQDDVSHPPAPGDYEQPVQEVHAAAELQFLNEMRDLAPGLQREPEHNCQVSDQEQGCNLSAEDVDDPIWTGHEEINCIEVTTSPFDILDQERGCNLSAEDVDDPIGIGHEEINYFEVTTSPFDILDQERGYNLSAKDVDDPIWTGDEEINYFDEQDGENFDPEQDCNDAHDQEDGLEPEYGFSENVYIGDDLTPNYDCFVDDGDGMETDGYDCVWRDGNEECETSGQCPSEEDIQQVHRFSQGRALLSGWSVQEIRHSSRTPARQPPLNLLEADVAKSLRDHWHRQRL